MSGFIARIYPSLIHYCDRYVDPENGHRLAISVLSLPRSVRRIIGLIPCLPTRCDDHILASSVFGIKFGGPVGMAAGFDKNGEAVDGLLDLGFDFVEIGSVTPRPQVGNPRPRVFRLLEDKCIINRYGFNSDGCEKVAQNLARSKNSNARRILGINIGKNSNSKNAEADYVSGLGALAQYGDYAVINVSSPNTIGLRDLQTADRLESLLLAVKETRDQLPRAIPLLVKIAPDLTEDGKKDIARIIMNVGIDGMVISNTTIDRPRTLKSAHSRECGGLSGPALKYESTQLIADMYRLTHGRIPIIGVGGISTGQDAYDKIKAGASLVQIYTSFVFEGSGVVIHIKRELAECLRRDGFSNIKDAIGTNRQF